jgi:hypothetical protein
LEVKPEWEALGVAGQDQGSLVDGGEEATNGLSFGAIRRGSESHVDGLIRHGDSAWRREDVRDDLLRFPRPPHVGGDQGGEFGLRVRADDADHVDNPLGEIRALDWRRDVDLIAGTLTINQQIRRGKTTTPKGRTRRTVPMTATLQAALRRLDAIRTGFVVRNPDGTAVSDNQTKYHCYRICRAAGLPEQGWHAAARLRDARGVVRRQPVEADAVDGAQADR